ncbi:MAG: dihydropteroate synthase [Mariprofundaceae bacterium]
MASRWHRPPGGEAWIMGVLNCTPDSFSDGGLHAARDAAIRHGLKLWRDGAAIVDVGGESTRPGAAEVPLEAELARVIPVVRALADAGVAVSVDTRKASVMRAALDAGATMINDVSALTHDPESLAVVADARADACLMHMRGTPETMQDDPRYDDVVDEVCRFFDARLEACAAAGIAEERLLLDPGIGFGKRLEHNLALIAGVGVLKRRFGLPVLLGLSRKSFIGQATGAPLDDRELETAVADAIGIFEGADGVRVHDVALQKRAVRLASLLAGARPPA